MIENLSQMMRYGERKRPEPHANDFLREVQVAYAPRTAFNLHTLQLSRKVLLHADLLSIDRIHKDRPCHSLPYLDWICKMDRHLLAFEPRIHDKIFHLHFGRLSGFVLHRLTGDVSVTEFTTDHFFGN